MEKKAKLSAIWISKKFLVIFLDRTVIAGGNDLTGRSIIAKFVNNLPDQVPDECISDQTYQYLNQLLLIYSDENYSYL
ncbi:hypothetical protein NIES4103_08550 [Nostoc sp. NIES-4103]|nr:hypothetical protein NIES4103_08550 [Nostoc sp. NIES-4103]